MKISFVVILLLIANIQLISQDLKQLPRPSKLYHKISAGYAFKSGQGFTNQQVDQPNGGTVYSHVPFSYGKGFNLSYGLGYMFHPNVGLELSASYFFGGINESQNTYIVTNVSSPYTDKQTVDENANMFRLSPTLIFTTQGAKVMPYAKFGLLFGWGSSKADINENVSYKSGGSASGKFIWEYSKMSGIGYTSAAGVRFKGDVFCDFFIELTHIGFGGAPKKGSLTTSEINGQSNLTTLSTSAKEIVFVDQLDTSITQNPDQPKSYLSHKSSFDSFGFNLGIIFKLYK